MIIILIPSVDVKNVSATICQSNIKLWCLLRAEIVMDQMHNFWWCLINLYFFEIYTGIYVVTTRFYCPWKIARRKKIKSSNRIYVDSMKN